MIGASLKSYAVAFLIGVSTTTQPTSTAQLPELRDLDLNGWDCLTKLEGAAKTQDGQERNRQKSGGLRSPN